MQKNGIKALIIAPNWLGDIVMMQPALKLLKLQYPDIKIDVLAPHNIAAICQYMPEVSDIFPTHFLSGKLQLRERYQQAVQLRSQNYDVVYVFPNSLKSALIPFMVRIPKRVGYVGEFRYGLLNDLYRLEPKARRGLMTSQYARLIFPRKNSLPKDIPTPHLVMDPKKSEECLTRLYEREHLDSSQPIVVFCPGAAYGPAKRWPAEHFIALAQYIYNAFPKIQIIALGSKQDFPTEPSLKFIHNFCGKTSIEEACALLSRAKAVVTNDSGLMHVAAALDRPVVALFGSSDPKHTPPLSSKARVLHLSLECSPCFARECPLGHFKCLKELKPDVVFEELRTILE